MVMSVLIKKTSREIKHSKGQFIALLTIVSIAVAFMVCMGTVFKNLNDSKESYYRDYNICDYQANVFNFPKDKLYELKLNDQNIKEVEGKIIGETQIEIDTKNITLRVVSYLGQKKENIINEIYMVEGNYFTKNGERECIVEEQFYKAHNLSIGDSLKISVNGTEYSLKIIGVGKTPEYVYPIKNEEQLIVDNDKFGIIFCEETLMNEMFNMNGNINQIIMKFKNEANNEELKVKIDEYLKEYGIIESVLLKDLLSNSMLESEFTELESLGLSFPIAVLIIAMAIMYIIISRIIKNQRNQIGIMKAIGFKNSKILLSYLYYCISVAIIGSIIGVLLGCVFAKYLVDIENAFFNLPLVAISPDISTVFIAFISTIGLCILAGIISTKNIFKILPSEAMRVKNDIVGKKIMLEKCKGLWSRFSFVTKMVFRNISRNKVRVILTCLGMIFATSLVLVGFGMSDSINYLISQQDTQVIKYDLKVDMTSNVESSFLDTIKNIKGVKNVEGLFEGPVVVSKDDQEKGVILRILEKNQELSPIINKKNEKIDVPSDGIVIPKTLAEDLDLVENDKIYIDIYYPVTKKIECKVGKIVEQYIGFNIFCDEEYISELLNADVGFNSIVIKLDSQDNSNSIISQIKTIDKVKLVETKEDIINSYKKITDTMNVMIMFCFVMALILALAVIYNITSINMAERISDITTLKLIGFKDRILSKIIIRENMIITIFGIVIGLPLGYLFTNYMMSMVNMESFSLPTYVNIISYIFTAIIVFVFTYLINLFFNRKISKIEVSQQLKVRE